MTPVAVRARVAFVPNILMLAAALVMAPVCLSRAAAPAQPVNVAESAREAIVQSARVTGSVRSPRTASLSAAVAGLVDSYQVEAGDRVARGERLLELDADLESLALSRAQAERRQVEAELADARRRLAEAERLDADIAETEVESRRTAVRRLEASLEAAAAAAAEQQEVVRRHSIHAPFAGVIVRRLAEMGEWVNPGDTLMELVATDDVWFDFQVPQNLYPKVSEETRITLTVDAISADEAIKGHIEAIVPVKDPGARTFLLRAVAEKPAHRVTPGMSARAVLRLETGRTGVTVPRDAVMRYPDGRTTVWAVANGGDVAVAEEHVVDTGLEFDGNIEIRSGLDAGIRVVTRGNESLQPGQRVRVQ